MSIIDEPSLHVVEYEESSRGASEPLGLPLKGSSMPFREGIFENEFGYTHGSNEQRQIPVNGEENQVNKRKTSPSAVYSKFPAGEINFTEPNGTNIFKPCSVNVSEQFVEALLYYDMHRRAYSHLNGSGLSLFLPYLPYSRQDRATISKDKYETPFALKVVGDILNIRPWKKIITLDVHSDVAAACVDNLMNIPIEFITKDVFLHPMPRTLVIPDQGAYKKLGKLLEPCGHDPRPQFTDSVVAMKHRDVATGKVETGEIYGDVQGKKCFIVDDICDGGATFIGLAKKLYERGAEDVSLFVTHGIFSKGVKPLREAGIKWILTTDSFPSSADLSDISVYSSTEIMERYLAKHPT